MAGGVGTKLWPRSRRKMPKQFLDILGSGKTLIRETYERFLPLIEPSNFVVITTRQYRDVVLQNIPELLPNQVLCEPVGRNTAPAVCYAVNSIMSLNPNAELVVTPADHYINGEQEFLSALQDSFEFIDSHKGAIVTLGVRASTPETRYGYIQISDDAPISKVKCFTEKPTFEIAQQFIRSREFYWNSGLFVAKGHDILSTMERNLPNLYYLFSSIAHTISSDKERESIEQIYAECKPVSIDQGVMERADNIYVKGVDFGWSDVGTWGAVHQHAKKDCDGNFKNEGVFTFNTHNSYISTTQGKTAVISDMDDYIIIDTDDLLMICPRSEEQSIKRFIDEVKFYKSHTKR